MVWVLLQQTTANWYQQSKHQCHKAVGSREAFASSQGQNAPRLIAVMLISNFGDLQKILSFRVITTRIFAETDIVIVSIQLIEGDHGHCKNNRYIHTS